MIRFLVKSTIKNNIVNNSSNKINLNIKYFTTCCPTGDNHDDNTNNNKNNKDDNNITNVPVPPRVRYAPSPTGYLHLGGLRTALFNYLFAKKNNGTFILRIEDTDRNRFVEGSAKNLANCLEWAGIPYDEGPDKPGSVGPYIQSERLSIYKEHADKLISSGNAYHCFCTSERLESSRTQLKSKFAMSIYDRHCLKLSKEEIERNLSNNVPYTVRLKIPSEENTTTKFTDVVKGLVKFNNQLIDDQVLLKSDGYPTYHLASVVDDHLMGITHIIRGEEWLNSTPKHIILYEAFGWKPPTMVHVPLLLNSDKSKLSKRQGDVSVDSYIAKGYLPESLINFVAFLGWSPSATTSTDSSTPTPTTKEIFTLPELIDAFSLQGINKSGSVVNMDRLDWLNVNHIRLQLDKPSILENIKNQLVEYLCAKEHTGTQKVLNDEYFKAAVNCVKDRVHLIQDFNGLLLPFYKDSIDFQSNEETIKMKSKVWKGQQSVDNINLVIKQLESLENFNHNEIYKTLQSTCSLINGSGTTPLTEKELTTKTNQLMSNLRYLLLGTPVGGGIPLTIEVFGKEKTINTLKTNLKLQ